MFKTGRLPDMAQGIRGEGLRYYQEESAKREDLMNRCVLNPKQQGEQMVTIGDKAKAIIYGDREKTYGHPAKNLERIAKLWSAYLDKELTAYDVSNLMVLLKTARLQNTPAHEDTLVDIIGYTLLQERVKDADKVVTNT